MFTFFTFINVKMLWNVLVMIPADRVFTNMMSGDMVSSHSSADIGPTSKGPTQVRSL